MSPYYEDEWVTLYHGDCLNLEAGPRAGAAWLGADVLVTDPPYGIRWVSNAMWVAWGSRAKESRERKQIEGDESPAARDMALAAWGERPALVFGSWRVPRPQNVRQLLVWHKENRQPGVTAAPWFSTHEEIYVLGEGFVGKPTPTVYTTREHRARYTQRSGHPTAKPVALMSALLEKCPPGVVADPFAGSGSTLVAAKQFGRRAIGVELEESYCEIAAKRLSQDTLFGGAA